MLNLLLDLLFPTDCAGCGRPGASLCPACAADLRRPRAHRPEPCPAGLPPVAVAAGYDGPARSALLAYKERSRRDLAGPLAAGLAAAVRQVEAPGASVILVPVPSRRSAARARGGDHMLRLARASVAPLAALGLTGRVAPCLRVRRPVLDSAGLSATGRAANVAGAFEAVSVDAVAALRPDSEFSGAGPPRPAVILVDDLVTTGSTAAEATRALQVRGVGVDAIAAIAGTLRRHHSLTPQ